MNTLVVLSDTSESARQPRYYYRTTITKDSMLFKIQLRSFNKGRHHSLGIRAPLSTFGAANCLVPLINLLTIMSLQGNSLPSNNNNDLTPSSTFVKCSAETCLFPYINKINLVFSAGLHYTLSNYYLSCYRNYSQVFKCLM
jgi:hypothetical protein